VHTEREDEISVPPASIEAADLDEHDERFFAEGEAASQHGVHLADAPKVIAGRASSDDRPAVHAVPPERREKLAKYVKYAVALCGLLCGVALVRVAVSRSHPVVAEAAAAQVALPPPAPVLEPPAPAEPEPAPAATEAPASGKSAKEEMEAARALLEHGKTKDALEGAARSVALDPTDAEAWLILGAAQLNAGHSKEAREAFVECTKQAKAGPVVECRNMLR
jgi:cytochrome c-type biogenesis protein CcmH/NrfG